MISKDVGEKINIRLNKKQRKKKKRMVKIITMKKIITMGPLEAIEVT